MCGPRVGVANPLFSVCIALGRPMATANPKKPSDESRTNATYVKFHTGSEIGDKPEHDPLNNNNYIYIFRNIKSLNYVLFLLCVCLIYQS